MARTSLRTVDMPGVQGPVADAHLAPANERPGPSTAWTAPAALLREVGCGAAVEVLYVHVPFASELDTAESARAYEHLLDSVSSLLGEFFSRLGCAHEIRRWPADDFVVWLSDSPARPLRPLANGGALGTALGAHVRQGLAAAQLHPLIQPRIDQLSVASARMPFAAGGNPVRAYARALHAAQRSACDPVAREKQQGTEAMDAAIVDRAFLFHYQPIVDTRARRILAYEALARGTRDPLRFPDVIFSTAERCDRIWELGRVLRDIAADGLDGWVGSEATPDPLLFINVHPRDIEDPVFLEQALSGGLARHAHRVVIELTERAAIADYRRVKPFFATLRRRGFRLAIDDLGSGYAGLTSLAELEPDFIKFDMGLVRDLHLHPVKQRLIERMNEFAEEIGAQTISEGVETAEERDALVRAGCCHMQGYFFARPAPRPPEIPAERWPDPVAD